MTKPLHAGQAARNGVMAAVLATRGFTSSAIALEGANGYSLDFCRDLACRTRPSAISAGARLAEIGSR